MFCEIIIKLLFNQNKNSDFIPLREMTVIMKTSYYCNTMPFRIRINIFMVGLYYFFYSTDKDTSTCCMAHSPLFTCSYNKEMFLIAPTLSFLKYFSDFFILDFTHSIAGRYHVLLFCVNLNSAFCHCLVKLWQLMSFDSHSL